MTAPSKGTAKALEGAGASIRRWWQARMVDRFTTTGCPSVAEEGPTTSANRSAASAARAGSMPCSGRT